MNQTLHVLLAACFLMVTAGATGLYLHLRRTREMRRRQRIALVSRGPAPTRRAPAAIARADPQTDTSLLHRVAGLFGYRPEQAEAHPYKWWMVLIVTFVLARLAALLSTIILGDFELLALLPAWFFLSRAVFAGWNRKRQQVLTDMLPDALSMIVRTVRVGVPVTEAMRIISVKMAPPIAGEFGRVYGQINVGVPLEDALRTMAARTGIPKYRFLATTRALQAQTGGALAETLENLAEIIRMRIALRARGHALASEARTSATMLTVLPFVTALVLLLVSTTYIMPLFLEPAGQRLIGFAILLLTCGTFVMRTIIRKTLS